MTSVFALWAEGMITRGLLGLERGNPLLSFMKTMTEINGNDQVPTYSVSGGASDLCCDVYGRSVDWLHESVSDSRTDGFLVGRGWSATDVRWKQIGDAKMHAMAINDYPETAKPRYWITGDPPGYFDRRIWLDPNVMKFCADSYSDELLPRSSAYGRDNKMTPKDCPNVNFYHKTCNGHTFNFLWTPWVNWGTYPYTKEEGNGLRSSMLCGLRMMWHLGYRRVFLLGCDFVPHQHGRNPDYFINLQNMLTELKPEFDKYGYQVVNTSEDSHLRAFPFMSFDKAIREAA